MNPTATATEAPATLPKAPTGIIGLDEITEGGLPRGRPTLVSGEAGSGKTMLATEFLVRGALQYGEPGVFMTFEETGPDITANVRSLGFDLDALVEQRRLVIDHVRIERSEIEETGEYDLEGLFIRLGHAVQSVGAKRVVLDTVEALFAGLPNHAILRTELRRLFRWLKDHHLTTVITGEKGEGRTITRYGLEEYVADCVIVLDQRVHRQISTRRLRVLKYRGTAHGTNEYPFLIGEHGLSVLPITSLRLDHQVSAERISTGVAGLDEMFGGQGIYRGSSVLVSGGSGTGKSTIAVGLLDAACRRGERALLFAYEESAPQIVRNMRSVGIELEPWIRQDLLRIHASRPTLHGLEQHLVVIDDLVRSFRPAVVAVDPISNLELDPGELNVKSTLLRVLDGLKQQGITGVFTALAPDSDPMSVDTESGMSSLMDTWILLRNVETDGERNRTLYVLKSRGMAHSNQVREFVMSDEGVELLRVYLGTDRVLTGSARVAQAARERVEAELRAQEHQRRLRKLEVRRRAIQAQIVALQAELETEVAETEFTVAEEDARLKASHDVTDAMTRVRGNGRKAHAAGKDRS